MIGFKHVAYLLPGDVHVFFLIFLNHSGAKATSDTKSRIEIQFVDPVPIVRQRRAVGAGEQSIDCGVPAPVKRRRN